MLLLRVCGKYEIVRQLVNGTECCIVAVIYVNGEVDIGISAEAVIYDCAARLFFSLHCRRCSGISCDNIDGKTSELADSVSAANIIEICAELGPAKDKERLERLLGLSLVDVRIVHAEYVGRLLNIRVIFDSAIRRSCSEHLTDGRGASILCPLCDGYKQFPFCALPGGKIKLCN